MIFPPRESTTLASSLRDRVHWKLHLAEAEHIMSREKLPPLQVSGNLWLGRKGQTLLGGYRIDLLESIERTGTLTQAAKDVGLSYKAAWDAVDAMNNLAEKPLVVRSAGGRAGGHSGLTEHGRRLVQLYRLLESGWQQLLTRMQAELGDFEQLNTLMRALTVRTSARNELRGTVKTVRKGAVNADVILDVGDGLEVFASITNEAVDELELRPGRHAFALIKSSFVVLTDDPTVRVSARNRLCGIVSAVEIGAVNSKVKIRLAGERTLTAIITNEALNELELSEGSACCALVKASHVLIAVND
jgi:molybdate transport system regulatory protein